MKILCSILVGLLSLWTPAVMRAQFGTIGGNGQPGHSSAAPTSQGQCSAGNNSSGNSASCTIPTVAGGTIVVNSFNFNSSAPPSVTSASGAVAHLGCSIYGTMVFCLDVFTGVSGTSNLITGTSTSGAYLSVLAQSATASTVDGGTGSCNGTTGCSMTGGTTLLTTVTGANIIVTGNDLVFAFAPIGNGAEVLTAGSTPIAMTLGANLASNSRAFYGTTTAGTTYATATGNQSGTFPWAFGTVALHP